MQIPLPPCPSLNVLLIFQQNPPLSFQSVMILTIHVCLYVFYLFIYFFYVCMYERERKRERERERERELTSGLFCLETNMAVALRHFSGQPL